MRDEALIELRNELGAQQRQKGRMSPQFSQVDNLKTDGFGPRSRTGARQTRAAAHKIC